MNVIAAIEPLVLPTYPVGEPETNPLFFDKRVYQGSCGKVYPVPFIDKVFDEPRDVTYRAVRLENEFVRLVLLPEIGGRILRGQDRTRGDFDFFYRQDVIKPALVGLAGPWISGGVEFNWPQHHRPGTFLPADVHIEEEPDGARTVWMSEHDPLHRLKGMHGLRLRPGSARIELRARLYNRTPSTRTFLWWANVAARVHEHYQSFFPQDVHYVADHAMRAQSTFPLALGTYYGVRYGERAIGANDLSWYRNIPVPTSYMVCASRFDFLGGYDHAAGAGFVHVANRHMAPGKKQWTWGHHAFGEAWDRELTDDGGPYIELMAGVYSDNQPDFSYLRPYETKTFTQSWWPYQELGPLQNASEDVGLRLVVREDRSIELGVCASHVLRGVRVVLKRADHVLAEHVIDVEPGKPWQHIGPRFEGDHARELEFTVFDAAGHALLSFRPIDRSTLVREREQAQEPAAPADIKSSDELYFVGEHLELYRHPTRSPELYWGEALARDPNDVRCNVAMGWRRLRAGLFEPAAQHFEAAIARSTFRHPNPESGEAHYGLGLTRFFQERLEEAHAAFFKATWNYEWRGAAHYHLACIACRHARFDDALQHIAEGRATLCDHNKFDVLEAIVLRTVKGRPERALALLDALLCRDPLDAWALYERSLHDDDFETFLERTRNDAQTILDLAFDYADAGWRADAMRLLAFHHDHPLPPCPVPNPLARSQMTRYLQAWLTEDLEVLAMACAQSPARFFPSRLHEQIVLEWATHADADDAIAHYALGNYAYDRGRRVDAMRSWERAIAKGRAPATAHRNLAIACWNVDRDGERARRGYERALDLDPEDARLVIEFDQLRSKLNDPLEDRLAFLEARRSHVLPRDDASIALATLYNLLGRSREALELLLSRRFHPWEGGEGAVLRQYTLAHVNLGREALRAADAAAALEHFERALQPPESLGEAYHPHQAKADVSYWTGKALAALGRTAEARAQFTCCAQERGDFSAMAVVAHGPLTYYRALALRELDRAEEAHALLEELEAFGHEGLRTEACIDYFATSLPDLLVFDEDLQARHDAEHHLLIAQACYALGRLDEAREHLDRTLAFRRDDPHAIDLDARIRGEQPGP